MLTRPNLKFFLILCLFFQVGQNNILAGPIPDSETINICAEDTGWPPFSIPEYTKGIPTGKLTGFNQELLTEMLTKHGINFKFIIKPWSRCLYEGIHGNIQVVLDAAANEQRRNDYILTEPIYNLTPVFFYNTKSQELFSKMPYSSELYSKGDLCGQSGYTYTNFGLDN